MNVYVVLFARAKELAGAETIELSMSDEATVQDLKVELVNHVPALQPLLEHCMLSVNQEYATDDTRLAPNCEVGLIPPVSGG